jgi:hypothetical protein
MREFGSYAMTTVENATLDPMKALDWRYLHSFVVRFLLCTFYLALTYGYLRGITEYFLGYGSHEIIIHNIMFPTIQ